LTETVSAEELKLNFFTLQCNGAVVDLKEERLLYWGLNVHTQDGLPQSDLPVDEYAAKSLTNVGNYYGAKKKKKSNLLSHVEYLILPFLPQVLLYEINNCGTRDI